MTYATGRMNLYLSTRLTDFEAIQAEKTMKLLKYETERDLGGDSGISQA